MILKKVLFLNALILTIRKFFCKLVIVVKNNKNMFF